MSVRERYPLYFLSRAVAVQRERGVWESAENVRLSLLYVLLSVIIRHEFRRKGFEL